MNIIKRFRYHCRVYKNLFCNKESFLHTTGWIKSFNYKKPVDANNNPTPWMNYAIVEFLKQRFKNDFNLFEYGSGFSTIFYSNLVNSVISIEYDKNWFACIKNMAPLNAKVYFYDNDVDGKYSRSIRDFETLFQVIIIDGRDRVNCIKQSLPNISPDGVIILDDSDREEYKSGILFLELHGFRELPFYGFKPRSLFISKTSIFYRNNNCFGI
jgi:hypothetical protein